MRPKQVLQSELLISTPRLAVRKDRLMANDGSEYERLSVLHPGAVVILAIANESASPAGLSGESRIVFVRQWRQAVNRELLELPAGTLEQGEEPEVCAKRELMEETGYRGATWQSLGVLYPAPGFCDECQHIFLVQNLQAGLATPESSEELEVVLLTKSEVIHAIKTQEIVDAKTLATLYRASIIFPDLF